MDEEIKVEEPETPVETPVGTPEEETPSEEVSA